MKCKPSLCCQASNCFARICKCPLLVWGNANITLFLIFSSLIFKSQCHLFSGLLCYFLFQTAKYLLKIKFNLLLPGRNPYWRRGASYQHCKCDQPEPIASYVHIKCIYFYCYMDSFFCLCATTLNCWRIWRSYISLSLCMTYNCCK